MESNGIDQRKSLRVRLTLKRALGAEKNAGKKHKIMLR